jgi:hypothetical protein
MEGLKRIYYAAGISRYDDFFLAPPLVGDKNWTPLVKAMKGARVVTPRLLGADGILGWVDEPNSQPEPVLAAVRPLDKGRVGVLSMDVIYTHAYGYYKPKSINIGEHAIGALDGAILKKGDGRTPSDTGAFIGRLYAWLGAASAQAGFGGYKTSDTLPVFEVQKYPEELSFKPVIDIDNFKPLPSWKHRTGVTLKINDKPYWPQISDPFIPGEVKFFKALVGAHSEFSDGTGSVEEWAKAAKEAGYDAIVFTENFEKLSESNFEKLKVQCEKNTTDDFVCLPGYDIQDVSNNHFMLLGPYLYPRQSWLSPDGKRVKQINMVNYCNNNHMIIVHRAASSPLPIERIKSIQGMSVFTYRNGKLVDSSLGAYAWQVMSASAPNTVVVHETFSPADVAKEAKTGFQQILPGGSLSNAISYFRSGHGNFFECPARYIISEGPSLTAWTVYPRDAGPAEENRQQFRVDIGVSSDVALKTVTLYDGFNIVRCWRPNTKEFNTATYFRHDKQYGLWLMAEDANGRKVISTSIRTVPSRFHFRCSDRQNWLGHVALQYAGTDLPFKFNIFMPIKGTDEGSAIFTETPGTSMAGKLNFPLSSPELVLNEVILDEKYVEALFKDVGYDNRMAMASKSSGVYDAKVRCYSFSALKPDGVFPTLLEYDITLKRDVEPRDGTTLFPAFSKLRSKKYSWYDKDGKFVTGELTPTTTLDIPVGGIVSGLLVLSEGFKIDKGLIGLAYKPTAKGIVPAGTHYAASFVVPGPHGHFRDPLPAFDENPEAWLNALGFGPKLPYQLKLERGKLEGLKVTTRITPENGSVAGEITKAGDSPAPITLEISGMNANWPVGIWRPGDAIPVFGTVFEGKAWARLDPSKAGKFVAGNLIVAGDPNLSITVIAWTKDRLRLELHNPGAEAISIGVSTVPGLQDLKILKKDVSVPAGSSVIIDEKPQPLN